MRDTLVRPDVAETTDASDLVHITTCCDPDTALCGFDVTGTDWTERAEPLCIVCEDLARNGFCTGCGKKYVSYEKGA